MQACSIVLSGSVSSCLSVADLRDLSSRHFGGVKWQTAAKKLAERAGGIHVLLADGRLRIFTRKDDGKVCVSTWKPGQYSFEK